MSDQKTDYIVVYTTVATQDKAERIARALVETRLVSCAQMSPITSIYSWKGDICHEPEILLTLRTRKDLYSKIETTIKSMHSYETPQIIALPILAGSADYLAWISKETTK